MHIIGITGFAGSGKDSAALALASHGYKRISFAEPLKKIAYGTNPLIGYEGTSPVYYADAVDRLGEDAVKRQYPEARRFLQRLGTEGVRAELGDSFWSDYAVTLMKQSIASGGADKFAIPDMRFPNEFEALAEFGGTDFFSMRIVRPDADISADFADREGAQEVQLHPSEQFVNELPVDVEVINDSTLEDLARMVEVYAR